MNKKIMNDPWLTKIMKKPVYKVGEIGVKIISDSQGPEDFFFTKIKADNIVDLKEFCQSGFCLVDVTVLMRFDERQKELRQINQKSPVSITVAEKLEQQQADQLLSIAERCFQYSRFHKDPKIQNEVADRVEKEWIRTHIEKKRGDQLFMALIDGQVVGFLAAIKTKQEDQMVASIDLMGIDPDYQKRGTGRALVNKFANYYLDKVDAITVSTQLINVPAIKLYQSCGFYHEQSFYVLHGHGKMGNG